MTTLTATAHASDRTSVRATATLAKRTLAKIEDLASGIGNGGAISYEMLGRLAADTSRRVSPEVTFIDETTQYPASARLPIAAAETLLSAMREAVRNALRHSGAQRVEVFFRAEWTVSGHDLLTIRVRDDGRGFDSEAVPATRLGIRLSMTEPLAAVGASWRLDSGAGRGDDVRDHQGRRGPPGCRPSRSQVGPGGAVASREVSRSAAGGGHLGGGSRRDRHRVDQPGPALWCTVDCRDGADVCPDRDLAAQRAVAAASDVGGGQRADLDRRCDGSDGSGGTHDDRPDIAMWQGFPMQLVLVILIIRRRPWFAAIGLVLICALLAVWCSFTPFDWDWVLGATFGPIAFVLMALLVNRVLLTIARRQRVLREQERAAIDDSVRRHVALVQRWLWISDLKAETRATLRRISDITDDVPADLRAEALLVEATLREALSARNVMNEELADLTEEARRRGVSVTFVDSRRSPVSGVVGRAVMAEVRTVLDSASVSRLVVRLGPDDGIAAASVVTDDGTSTSLTMIDSAGTRQSRTVAADDH